MSNCGCESGYSRKPKGSIRQFICYLLGLGDTNTLSSGTKFIITQGSSVLSITWSDILKNIAIYAQPVQTHNKVLINDDYQQVGDECEIIAYVDSVAFPSGLNVSLIEGSTSEKSVIIKCVSPNGGQVNIVPFGSETVEDSQTVINQGDSARLTYYDFSGESAPIVEWGRT